MGRIYNFNSSNNKNSKLKFYPNLILIAIACYCFDNIGAFLVLIFSRGKSNRLVTLHAAQSMIFYLIVYFAQLVLQSFGYTFLSFFGLGFIVNILFQLILLAKIAFIVFGIFNLVTGKPLYIPYLSDISSRWA